MKQMQKSEEQEEEEGGLDDVSGGYSGGCIPINPTVPVLPGIPETDDGLSSPTRTTNKL